MDGILIFRNLINQITSENEKNDSTTPSLADVNHESQSHRIIFLRMNRLKEENTNFTVFTNATLFITPNQAVTKSGTSLIQNGKVISAGNGEINSGKFNCHTIWRESISILPLSMPIPVSELKHRNVRSSERRSPQYEASREGFYWNDHIMPEQRAIDSFTYDKKELKNFGRLGLA